jgi:hypothetical protein
MVSCSGKCAFPLFDLHPAIRCTRTRPTAAVARLFNYRILARLGPLWVISGHTPAVAVVSVAVAVAFAAVAAMAAMADASRSKSKSLV